MTGNPPQAALEELIALYGHGRLAEALDQADALLAQYPQGEILHNIAGALAAALGRHDVAAILYDRAIAIAPDYLEAYNNRGNALKDCGRLEDAVASYDAAIGLMPDYAAAHMNRGIALATLRRLDEALASYDRAVAIDPGLVEAYNNRGNLLGDVGRSDDALADYAMAIGLRPDYADAHVNRGNVLKATGRLREALAGYDHAIAIAPDLADAHVGRGAVLKDMRRLDEALLAYEAAIRISPGFASAIAELHNLRAHMCLWTSDAPDLPGMDGDPVPPFYMLNMTEDPQRQLTCARAWAKARYGEGRAAAAPVTRQGRIRLGYFSADFHNHATMYLMARLFELHDKSRFEVHAFSYGVDTGDAMRGRLLKAVDEFHAVAALSDRAVADLARSRSIDIAIDLKGYTEQTRSGIFAYRAAPIQVAYLGYPGTMGADFIDHIIADAIVIPDAHRPYYSENVIHLPGSYQVNDNRRAIAEVGDSRSALGLPEEAFIFCCFNSNYKISPAEFDIWMRLLDKVDGSILWLLKDNRWAEDNLRREATARGIDPARLIFAEKVPLPEHLARHAHADLFLDTFRVNAHTTASDALWAGLPVVARLGGSFAARVAASLLHAIGLPELVADTAEAYEALALDLATDPARLGSIRARLAANRLTTPLFDTERFTRDIENVFQTLADSRA